MTTAALPQTIFTTRRHFNDYNADDMRCGDLNERQLKEIFQLSNISNIVNPYTLTRLTPFDNPQSRFAGVYATQQRGASVTLQECARLLFSEMQVTSLPYACVGPYKDVINSMLRHFQQSTGAPYRDIRLDMAYKQQIQHDISANSTRLAIQRDIDKHINYTKAIYPSERLFELGKIISTNIMPKFDSMLLDKINGLGISVHDVYATRIELVSLEVSGNNWKGKLRYQGQDHFGLDNEDIRKKKFHQFQFFKIWFVLQRYNKFGFRPFLTNLEATVDIEGGKA